MFELDRNGTPRGTQGEVQGPRPRYAVVLSDIHIGNGTPTCWYQPRMHDPQLTEILRWIIARRATIREVVLLGDMFDVWTYPPNVRPPSMAAIIAANPVLLGARGPFGALVRALPGKVKMLLGNHDESVTRADVDALNRSLGGNIGRGERIDLLTAPWHTVTGASGARTVFSHGHHWCMFNAPDRRSRWGALPIGHFVTRAIGYHLSRTLPRGVTSADRRNHGNPGFDIPTLLRSWNPRDDLAAVLLRYICRATGMPETMPIVMPDGSTTTVRDAIRVYAGIFPMWVAREGRMADAMRAAAADQRHEDLAYFAQRLALRTASDLAVMGHTHVPVGGLRVSPVNYANSGYECVARPDTPGRQFTFTQVDLERASAQVLAVVPSGGGFTVSPARAPSLPSVIVRPWMDYSCYARIENRSSQPLRLVRSAKSASSWWAVPPPALIAPRSVGNVWLQDAVGTSGSSGSFSYSDGSRTLDFAMACPTGLSANVVRSPVPDYETRTGATTAWRRGGVDRFGHPVQARFYVGARVPGGMPVPAPPVGPGVPGPGPDPRGSSGPAPAQESRYAVAARAILNRAGTPPTRGTVLTVAHLTANDGRPLLDPTTRPSRTSPRGEELVNPPNRLLGPQVQTITLPDGTTHRYVWTQPSVPPVSPPNAGGIAFLPPRGSATFTIVTFNVAGLDGNYRGRCTNGHHSESQLTSFVNGNPAWRTRIGKLELHNRSRRGPGWGYSACNACLHDLAVFLTALNRPPRPGPVRASISWERLYDKNRACGHPTDAANIRRLVQAGWDEPMGPRPSGTRWPTPTPGRPRVPARPRVRTP